MSGNVNIGFIEKPRSRVLKPPGGGYSGIFDKDPYIEDAALKCKTPKHPSGAKGSTIESILRTEEVDSTPVKLQNDKRDNVASSEAQEVLLEKKVELLEIKSPQEEKTDSEKPTNGDASPVKETIVELKHCEGDVMKTPTKEQGEKINGVHKTEFVKTESTPAKSTIGSIIHQTPSTDEKRPQRNRIPPGGYSSGLW